VLVEETRGDGSECTMLVSIFISVNLIVVSSPPLTITEKSSAKVMVLMVAPWTRVILCTGSVVLARVSHNLTVESYEALAKISERPQYRKHEIAFSCALIMLVTQSSVRR